MTPNDYLARQGPTPITFPWTECQNLQDLALHAQHHDLLFHDIGDLMTAAADTTSTLIPSLRYRDAYAAIEWLEQAFGFQKNAVYEDELGGVAHAQLTFGRGMVMLGSVRGDTDGCTAQPDEVGGRVTQSTYWIVVDCKAHYERARAAGAKIVDEYAEKDYGGAGYSCLDPEGHLWSFGSYDPWQAT